MIAAAVVVVVSMVRSLSAVAAEADRIGDWSNFFIWFPALGAARSRRGTTTLRLLVAPATRLRFLPLSLALASFRGSYDRSCRGRWRSVWVSSAAYEFQQIGQSLELARAQGPQGRHERPTRRLGNALH